MAKILCTVDVHLDVTPENWKTLDRRTRKRAIAESAKIVIEEHGFGGLRGFTAGVDKISLIVAGTSGDTIDGMHDRALALSKKLYALAEAHQRPVHDRTGAAHDADHDD